MSIIGWYYLHENGDLIYKRELGDTAADIRESSFAKAMWPMDPQDRAGAWRILTESLCAGANRARVLHLAAEWQCDDEDAKNYAEHLGCDLFKDGNQWCVTPPGFINLQENYSGFGSTCLEAFADLCRRLGYRPSKMWGKSFRDLIDEHNLANGQFGVGA